MKSKHITYLLLPIVATIWAYAVYLYFLSEPKGENQQGLTTLPTNLPTTFNDAHGDTFALLGNYQDPFLGKMPSQNRFRSSDQQLSNNTTSQPTSSSRPTPTQPSSPFLRSNFQYNGQIQRSGTNELIGILRIDGKTHFVNVGHVVMGIEIIRMGPDSIQLSADEDILILGRH